MRIFATTTTRDPEQTKPKIRAIAAPGHATMRLAGNPACTLTGIRRRKFPFDDQTPLKTPGIPEQREYQARGIVGDDEVGQPSDFVSVTYAG